MRLPCLRVAAAAPAATRTVGVFGGEEAAFLRSHVAADVIENVARDCFEFPIRA